MPDTHNAIEDANAHASQPVASEGVKFLSWNPNQGIILSRGSDKEIQLMEGTVL